MFSFHDRKRIIMTGKRKILVHMLAITAFIALFLLPVLAFLSTEVSADKTAESAAVHTGDYVFFVVQNEDVPLAAAPTVDASAYIIWIGLASFAVMIMFVYSAWYMSVRSNIRELTGKLLPMERKAFYTPQGFFHPIRSYRLAKEAEDTVASMYVNYM